MLSKEPAYNSTEEEIAYREFILRLRQKMLMNSEELYRHYDKHHPKCVQSQGEHKLRQKLKTNYQQRFISIDDERQSIDVLKSFVE